MFLLGFLLSWIPLAKLTKYCNLCSDSSIETHFGVFFSSPRDFQEGFRQTVFGCNSTDVAKQECSSTCYSLNVTSLHIKSKKLIPFGVSYGCSSYVMAEELQLPATCIRKDIVLRTYPPYVVQAEYCSCRGDSCNAVTVLPTKTKVNHYFYQAPSQVTCSFCLFLSLFLPILPR